MGVFVCVWVCVSVSVGVGGCVCVCACREKCVRVCVGFCISMIHAECGDCFDVSVVTSLSPSLSFVFNNPPGWRCFFVRKIMPPCFFQTIELATK